ncbi:cytochrome P450 [Penicillium frequentans]|uniref:Cytochrome P450 n=1 Tax=Penicillium frequentans TaxID=3151616 RepID=A0AAD6GE80_9EURO|nr:cytochrome P450 [Penicillium glabrum]
MKAQASKAYKADKSGPCRKRHPRSYVSPHNRVDYLTHESGTGADGSWTAADVPSLSEHIQNPACAESAQAESSQSMGIEAGYASVLSRESGPFNLESIFGPLLLQVNPGFMDMLWEFDELTPSLSKHVPRWLLPRAYRLRDFLLEQVHVWHFLLAVDGQDDDSIASSDLGLIWVSVTNVVPSAMMTALHIFADQGPLRRVRESLKDDITVTNEGADGKAVQVQIDMEKVIKNSLLQAVYAETLRLHVQAFVTRRSAHESATIDNWLLQQDEVVMVNSYDPPAVCRAV